MTAGSSGSSPLQHLTSRQRAIIEILAKLSGKPITIGAISQKLGVSSRTVLREMPAVEKWLDDNDFSFTRKPGVGLVIEETAESIQLLEELLGIEQVHTCSQKERRRQILGELLYVREPVKSVVFLSKFHISEGTLAKDLDALGEWLAAYQVQISRRPGVGIFLEGSETAYRQAIAGAALEFVDDGEILKLLRETSNVPSEDGQPENAGGEPQIGMIKNRLLSFIDSQTVMFVEQILKDTEKQLNIKYTDSGYMALIVHLSLAIHRLQSGETIEMAPDELGELEKMSEYSVAEQIAEKIGSQFQLKIPPEETGFITMHLSSARIWPQTKRMRSQLQSMNTRQVVMSVIDSVEQDIGLPFHTCTHMIEELTSHMDSMISRLSMNIHLDNAQGDSVRQRYPEIYQAVEQACTALFRDRLFIEDISPSEVTFVAMHFAAAAETLQVKQKRVAVAVVCPSGMGASRVLAANLMRSIHNIEIRQIMSAFSLEQKKLKEDGIDLVISTVPLEIEFPFICVSPIPQEQDMLVITHAIDSISAQREKEELPLKAFLPSSPDITLDDIRSQSCTGEEIAQLLDHFLIKEVSGSQQIENLLGQAAGLFADSILSRQMISQDLARREEIRSTFIPELQIYLLHSRTRGVTHCRFGYLRLERAITIEEGTVCGAILLLAPQSDRNECVEVISQISMLLAEDACFLQALKSGDTQKGRGLAEKALTKYYQNLIMKRKGDGNI